MTNSLQHRQNRVYLSIVVAVSHGMLALLGIIHRLTFSVPSRYTFFQQTLDNPVWSILQTACFLGILITLYIKKGELQAMGAATGVMGAWAFLTLLWGLSTETSVSLAGPVLGGGIATLAYLLTLSWARAHRVQERVK